MNRLFVIIIFLLSGSFVGYLLMHYFYYLLDNDISIWMGLSIILWLPVCFIIAVAVHEVGHIAAGVIQGFEFKSLSIGPLKIFKEDHRLKTGVSKGIKGLFGFAVCLPADYKNIDDLKRQFAWYAFGGPAASGVLTSAAYLIAIYLPETSVTLIMVKSAFMGLAVLSAFTFLITIIPTSGGGYYTDGGRIYNIIRNNDEGKIDVALLSVMTNSVGGKAPDKLDIGLLYSALEINGEQPFKAYCHSYLYLIHLYEGRHSDALKHLDLFYHLKENLPPLARPSAFLEKAFYTAFIAHDANKAQEIYLMAGQSALVSQDNYIRVEAAIALASGKYEKAMGLSEKASRLLAKNLDRGACVAYNKWLKEIYEASKKQLMVD